MTASQATTTVPGDSESVWTATAPPVPTLWSEPPPTGTQSAYEPQPSYQDPSVITYAFSTPTLLGLMVMVKAMASGWPWQQKPKGPPSPYHTQQPPGMHGDPGTSRNSLISISISAPPVGLDVLRSLPSCKSITIFELLLKHFFPFLC